jgi:signal transduction histidine kinase/DNA-binding response OmpR family regulator
MADMHHTVDRVAELEEQNERLAGQIKRLVETEHELLENRLRLDAQVRIYTQLHAVGKQLCSTFDFRAIAEAAVRFVVYELNFERCIVLVGGDQQGFHTLASDGYFDDDQASAITSLAFPDGDPLLARLYAGADRILVNAASPGPELASRLFVDELLLIALRGNDEGRISGLLVAGNSEKRWRYHERVEEDAPAALGLQNLATQAAIALSNARFYHQLEGERAQLEDKVEQRTQALSQAMEGLKALDKMKTHFFANVSHEIRTPLTLSIGPLDMILKGQELPPSIARNLRTVYSNQLRLLKLIDDLLDFSKLEAGKMTLRARPNDIVETIRYYASTLEAAAEARKMRVEVRSEVPTLTVYVDRDKLEKIVMNLLSNAFKFTPDGGSIAIGIALVENGAVAEIRVADSGIGIPESALGRLFERFSQVDSSEKRKYSGTGIGLAMVKELTELHGGSVAVESEEGRGTTFILRFRTGRAHLGPASILEEDAVRAAESMRAQNLVEFDDERDPELEPGVSHSVVDAGAGAPSIAAPAAAVVPASGAPVATTRVERARVLVVDDTPAMRSMVAGILRSDYEVTTAVDGMAGLEAARRTKPDLVISDVMMPRMSGYELCAAIKQDPALARTPVILVTARAEMSMKLEGLEQGADDYLVKPFNIEELQSRARNLIHIRREQLKAATMERRALEKDLELVGAVQQMLVPHRGLSSESFTLTSHYRSAAQSGGDWWSYDVRPDGSLLVIVGDVTGHGPGAAMITATVAATYQTMRRSGRLADVAAVLDGINRSILDVCGGAYWMTMLVAEVVPARRTIELSFVGAPSVLHAGRVAVRAVSGSGTPLGCEQFRVKTVTCAYEAGDKMLIFTDGAFEFRATDGRPFGLRRLRDLFASHRRLPAQECRSAIVDELHGQQAKAALDDDITMILLELR